jgi:hypothetical protein
MWVVTLGELKVTTQAGQSGAMGIASVESTIQDDVQEVKRSKWCITNNTSQAAKPVPRDTTLSIIFLTA